MLRILHTSDWHLGHKLHELPRDEEHARFLAWLLETLEREKVDVLLVAGDIFESANPSADAQRTWYDFLGQAHRRRPSLRVVVIGGNHDSAARLDAPEALVRALGFHVVGALPKGMDDALDFDRLLVPIENTEGNVEAWIAAVPFLRPIDLPKVAEQEGDPLVEGVRRVYACVLEAALSRRQPGEALVAMGHCYLTGTALSELSERRILGGNQHALPADVFPEDWAYVALGHLHRPQQVLRDTLRYSGSPIPLSLPEGAYPHSVCLVELEGERASSVRTLEVPREVEILRIPKSGHAPLEEVEAALTRLPVREPGMPSWQEPFLEVAVALDGPRPDLRRRVEEAIEEKAARLVRLGQQLSGDGNTLADAPLSSDLRELNPEDVFRRRYARDHEGEPDAPLLAAFHELVEQVKQEEQK